MKIDLGLENFNSGRTSDPVNIVAIADDLIMLEDELHRTEQELDSLLLGYENLNALKTVISDHGYTDALKALFGDQIDENTISVSDESVLRTIKAVAKRAVLNSTKTVAKEWDLIKEYAEEFKLASAWLKNRKRDKSVEGLFGSSLNKTYDIADILELEITDFVSKQQFQKPRFEVYQVKSFFKTESLARVVEKKCKSYDLSELSDDALADVCDRAYKKISTTHASKIHMCSKSSRPHEITDTKELASYYGNQSRREAYASDKEGDEHEWRSADFYRKQADLNRDRITALFIRTKLRLIRHSCRQIFTELRKRGFTTHKPVN